MHQKISYLSTNTLYSIFKTAATDINLLATHVQRAQERLAFPTSSLSTRTIRSGRGGSRWQHVLNSTLNNGTIITRTSKACTTASNRLDHKRPGTFVNVNGIPTSCSSRRRNVVSEPHTSVDVRAQSDVVVSVGHTSGRVHYVLAHGVASYLRVDPAVDRCVARGIIASKAGTSDRCVT